MEVKQMSTKPSTFYQVKGYPGLENMAPWRKNIYKNNEKPFCDMTPIQYYDNVLHILKDDFKANWILCIDRAEQEIGGRVSKSGFTNLCLEHPTKKLYGRPMAVRMASNKPFVKTINNLTL